MLNLPEPAKQSCLNFCSFVLCFYRKKFCPRKTKRMEEHVVTLNVNAPEVFDVAGRRCKKNVPSAAECFTTVAEFLNVTVVANISDTITAGDEAPPGCSVFWNEDTLSGRLNMLSANVGTELIDKVSGEGGGR